MWKSYHLIIVCPRKCECHTTSWWCVLENVNFCGIFVFSQKRKHSFDWSLASLCMLCSRKHEKGLPIHQCFHGHFHWQDCEIRLYSPQPFSSLVISYIIYFIISHPIINSTLCIILSTSTAISSSNTVGAGCNPEDIKNLHLTRISKILHILQDDAIAPRFSWLSVIY